MRCRLTASTDKATVRAKPSAPWLANAVESPMFQPIDGRLDRRMHTPRGRKRLLFSSRSRSALERYPFPGNALTSSTASRRTRIAAAVKAPVETARPQLRIQCLRFVHHRHCHVHILAFPQDLVVKDELILILDKGDRNPEFDRGARLAFGNPTRVSLENRKDLLLVRVSSRHAEDAAPLGQSAAGHERRGL